ncbi:hypothetical protein KF840_18260 [bacterium]|nr:hypothetical protein [bacterium]
MAARLTRRQFLVAAGTVAASALVPSGARVAHAAPGAGPRTIYRLSVRGRRGSRASKLHNANLRFATAQAADQHRAHPGDRSRIVTLVVSADEFDRLFTARRSEVADLRALGGPVLVGDCNRDGTVSIDELVRGVTIALGSTPVSECPPFDRVPDGRVTVDELVRGVTNALR